MEENNARFTSEVKLDLNTYREYLRLYFCTDPRNLVARIFIIFFCISQIPILGNNDFSRMFLVFTIVIALIEWNTYQKNKDGGLGYKQMLHQESGNIPHNLVSFRQDGILFRNPRTGNETLERHESIQKIRESKHLLVLITDLKLQRVIDKRTLTDGTSAELLAFLREKCPNLKKRVVNDRFGRVVRCIQWVMIALCAAWSILSLFSVPEKVAGQLTNSTSYEEMADELSKLDIQISQDVMDLVTTGTVHYGPSAPAYHKVYYLLCWEGNGTYLLDGIPTDPHIPGTNPDQLVWVPSTSGVYWFDREFVNPKTIYTDFLRGIDAMSDELTFDKIIEDHSSVNYEQHSGIVSITFEYENSLHSLHAEYRGSRFDMDVISQLGQILTHDGDSQELWFCTNLSDGILVYYGTIDQVLALEQKTGLTFMDWFAISKST